MWIASNDACEVSWTNSNSNNTVELVHSSGEEYEVLVLDENDEVLEILSRELDFEGSLYMAREHMDENP